LGGVPLEALRGNWPWVVCRAHGRCCGSTQNRCTAEVAKWRGSRTHLSGSPTVVGLSCNGSNAQTANCRVKRGGVRRACGGSDAINETRGLKSPREVSRVVLRARSSWASLRASPQREPREPLRHCATAPLRHCATAMQMGTAAWACAGAKHKVAREGARPLARPRGY